MAAVSDAHVAASAVPNDTDPHWTPDGSHAACTIVVAVATPSEVHMANVGDARGYVVRPEAGRAWSVEQLTTDDSVAARAVAQGIAADVALNLPGGHAITAWLGADAHDVAAHVSAAAARRRATWCSCAATGCGTTRRPTRRSAGCVTAALPPPGSRDPPGGGCEHLVDWANEQGGADNICVALAPAPAAAGPPPASPTDEAPGGRVTTGPETAPFTAETFQNEYLAAGVDTVDAVVTVTAAGDPAAGAAPDARRATGPR